MKLRLRIGGGARAGETIDLELGRVYRIGRSHVAEVRIADDPYISRIHAELHPEPNGFRVKNLSQHGTLVAGEVVQGERVLKPSDVIMIGGTLVIYELEDPSGASRAWPARLTDTVDVAPPQSGALPPTHPLPRPVPVGFPETQAVPAPVPVGIAQTQAIPASEMPTAKHPPVPVPAASPIDAEAQTTLDPDEVAPVVFLPGDSREPSAEELAGFPLFAGVPAKTIEGSIIKRHKINDQPPIWLRKYKAGEVICREGDYGSTAFFITKGSVAIGINAPPQRRTRSKAAKVVTSFMKAFTGVVDAESDAPPAGITIDAPVTLPYSQRVAELGAGDLFGEMSCMSFYPRSATCVAGPQGVECLELLRSVLDFLRTNAKAAYKDRIEKNYRERSLDLALRNVPLFANLPAHAVEYLKPRISMVEFTPDTAICKEGDEADAFYLVRLGFVKVSQARAGGEVVLQYLGPGQFFGEIALIRGGKRTARCTAIDHVELIKISKSDFDEFLAKFPSVRETLGILVEDRLRQQKRLATRPEGVPLAQLADKGILNAQNLLVIDLDKCTRCDECVRACADSHGGVTRLVRDGLRVDRFLVATACRACTDPVCMIGCPVGSIRRRGSMEIVIEDWCIGCGKCAQQCPYGNIAMHPYTKEAAAEVESRGEKGTGRRLAVVNAGKGRAVTCDLCGGGIEPRCVYACPHDAAQRGHPLDLFGGSLSRT